MVPEVEVLGSGRAEIEGNGLQEEAAATKMISENIKAFITIVFIPLVMKKLGHPPLGRSGGPAIRVIRIGGF
jgi:hypothetical protein